MNTQSILLTSIAMLALLGSPSFAADEKKAEPKVEELALTNEQSALKKALGNQSRLRSFHVEVELKTPEGKATISGDLGEGTLSLLCTDVKGVKKHRLVAGGEFYLSGDGGKTWAKGEKAEKEITLLFNNIITAPIALQNELLKDNFTSKEEKLGGEDVLHLEKPAKGKEAAVHFWLCKEPDLSSMIFLRKAELTVSGTDLELPATIIYSNLAKPVKIVAPEAK